MYDAEQKLLFLIAFNFGVEHIISLLGGSVL